MTDYNDGLIHGWNGGECPVHLETEGDIWLRLGKTYPILRFGSWRWGHVDQPDDIIAFRVTKPYVEPPKPREWDVWDHPKYVLTVADMTGASGWTRIRVREVLE
jgi:hypothetical protein